MTVIGEGESARMPQHMRVNSKAHLRPFACLFYDVVDRLPGEALASLAQEDEGLARALPCHPVPQPVAVGSQFFTCEPLLS